MDVIFVAYYTKNSIYEEYAQNLIGTLRQFNLVYKIVPIEDRGDWYKNTQYKPTFLLQMLNELSPVPLVYIDVDALVYQNPQLFDELAQTPNIDIAAHILNHKKFGRRIEPELLSGTLYLANNQNVREIVSDWIEGCKKHRQIWDQLALDQVLKERNYKGFTPLPEQYCVIHDYMKSVLDPVIVHYQASRQYRTQKSNHQIHRA